MALLLMAPAIGSERRPAEPSQGTGQATTQRAQSATQLQGHGQTPPGAAGGAQRPPQTAEQQLAGWLWWKDEDVKKEMKLTDRQAQSINRIFENRVREVTPFYDDLQKQVAELDRMTKERTVDVAVYAVQVSRAEALRSKLNETRAVMLYTIYRQLNPDQYQRLREIRDKRWGGRGRGGPGPRTW